MKNGRYKSKSGDTFVLKYGMLHCIDGPAIIWNEGTREWWINGQRHREGGPAIERSDGAMFWYKNGKLHRDDGPAIAWPRDYNEWYIDGIEVTKEEFDKRKLKEERISLLQLNLTPRTAGSRRKT